MILLSFSSITYSIQIIECFITLTYYLVVSHNLVLKSPDRIELPCVLTEGEKINMVIVITVSLYYLMIDFN